ncbi:hypothetical protein CVT26_000814 [Gymnopilus dilepis]|uniref:DUF7907 domain-containing protein n=1 Tax=Gymnopilus dilepis TaxID=231916 RepID=A0A409WL71_9AGAR|nr:hypothetical protein CVT26_000814 [Gymnopilus dilepis]
MSKKQSANLGSQYFLKTACVQPTANLHSKFDNLYLRHHSGGINAIMIMPSPPKFIKAHSTSDSRILFTSASHPERQWGLVLGRNKNTREDKLGAWEEVLIVQDEGDKGFVWRPTNDLPGGEELVWIPSEVEGGKDEDKEGELSDNIPDYKSRWRGWMVCEWQYEHPQLFWITDALKDEIPNFCERVRIWRERLE